MQRSPHTGGATLGLTTPQQGVRSEWTTHFLAPRSYWAPFSYLQPSHPSGSSSLARSAHASWNGSPNPALHYVQSVVNSGLDGHPFPQFRGLREGPALRWPQISREDGNARCSQAGLPGLQNSIPPGFPPILPLALRSRIGQESWSVVLASRRRFGDSSFSGPAFGARGLGGRV